MFSAMLMTLTAPLINDSHTWRDTCIAGLAADYSLLLNAEFIFGAEFFPIRTPPILISGYAMNHPLLVLLTTRN